MKTGILAFLILLGIGGYYGYQYYQDKQKAEQEEKQKAEQEEKQKAEQEARIKAEEEARIKAEEEAKKKAEEEAKKKAEEEERLRAEEEERLRAEEEERKKAEEEEAKKKAALIEDAKEEEVAAETKRQELWKQASEMTSAERLKIIEDIVKDRVRRAVLIKSHGDGADKEKKEWRDFYDLETGVLKFEQTKVEKPQCISEDNEKGAKQAIDAVTKYVDSIIPEKKESKILLAIIEKAIYNKMPLDADMTIKLSPEIIEQLEERAEMEYRLNEEELKERFTAEAEKMFPAYNVGEEVTVYRRIHGGTFDKVIGKFYRQDAEFVWIGNKKIAKSALREDYVPRFDPELAERLKKEHVKKGIKNYAQEKKNFANQLKDETLHESRGYVRYDKRWLSVRETVKRVYQERILEEKSREFVRLSVILAKDKERKNTLDGDRTAVLILKDCISRYPGAPNIKSADKLMEKALKKHRNVSYDFIKVDLNLGGSTIGGSAKR